MNGWCELCLRFEIHLSPEFLYFSEPQLAGEVDIEVSASVIEALVPHPKLRARFADIVEGVPLDAFRVECLRPVGNNAGSDRAINEFCFTNSTARSWLRLVVIKE